MGVAWGTLAFLLLTRADALVDVMRGGREPYRLLPTARSRLKTGLHRDAARFTASDS